MFIRVYIKVEHTATHFALNDKTSRTAHKKRSNSKALNVKWNMLKSERRNACIRA